MAAPVTVQVAIGTDVDREIIGVESAVEPGQQIVAAGAGFQSHVQHLGALGRVQPRAIS